MNISERENILKLYRHEPLVRIPNPSIGSHYSFPNNGFWERPPYNKGGKDWFGVDWIYEENTNAPVPNHSTPPILDDICQWRKKIIFPDLDKWDWEEAKRLDNVKSVVRQDKVYVVVITVGFFERLHALMGFENALCSMAIEQDEVGEFFNVLAKYKCKLIDKLVEHYKPDVINFHDDWGTQNDTFGKGWV